MKLFGYMRDNRDNYDIMMMSSSYNYQSEIEGDVAPYLLPYCDPIFYKIRVLLELMLLDFRLQSSHKHTVRNDTNTT